MYLYVIIKSNNMDKKIARKTISKLVSHTTVNSVRNKEQVKIETDLLLNKNNNKEEADDLRKAYEVIIVAKDWKQQFKQISDDIVQNLTREMETKLVSEDEKAISVAFGNFFFNFNSDDNNCVFIGRLSGCDVLFPDTPYSSRLNGILFPFPQFGIYVIVDLGSFFGIVTEKRSSDKACVSSLPEKEGSFNF